MSDERVRLGVIVKGRVQGVGYRYFVLEQAQALGLSGWVMNLDDGDVEAEIEGETTTVDALIKALRKGPSVARVSDLSLTALTPTGVNTGFRVRHR